MIKLEGKKYCVKCKHEAYYHKNIYPFYCEFDKAFEGSECKCSGFAS